MRDKFKKYFPFFFFFSAAVVLYGGILKMTLWQLIIFILFLITSFLCGYFSKRVDVNKLKEMLITEIDQELDKLLDSTDFTWIHFHTRKLKQKIREITR